MSTFGLLVLSTFGNVYTSTLVMSIGFLLETACQEFGVRNARFSIDFLIEIASQEPGV